MVTHGLPLALLQHHKGVQGCRRMHRPGIMYLRSEHRCSMQLLEHRQSRCTSRKVASPYPELEVRPCSILRCRHTSWNNPQTTVLSKYKKSNCLREQFSKQGKKNQRKEFEGTPPNNQNASQQDLQITHCIDNPGNRIKNAMRTLNTALIALAGIATTLAPGVVWAS